MTFVSCSVPERFVNPLFEVFDGGDFILSSYRDIEEPFARMRIYLESASDVEAAKRCLQDAVDVVGVETTLEVGEIADEDWKFAYRRHFKTEPIGSRLLTVPVWELAEAKAKWGTSGRQMIVLDPGMAFGTGKHETTRACLEYIDELSVLRPSASDFRPSTFLDMGCGSGILSIAAAKLGFGTVKGFDVDQEAVDASVENAETNGVKVDYAHFALGRNEPLPEPLRLPDGATFDLVAANILGPLLIRFADEIVPYASDRLILSGILTELYPEVRAAYEARGFREASSKVVGEWQTGLFVRAGILSAGRQV